ncbi:MAG TPA: hypothetical protein VFN29_04120 [Chiayiivirga sp.]|nr:hypothetical protein [Chiayiivirga sp.]
MINPYRIISTNLPDRFAPPRNAVPSDPKGLRAWLDALPRANQQVYLRELQRVLMEFRVQRFDGMARLDAMEILRPMLLEACNLLSSRLLGSSFPLTGAKAESAARLLSFHRDLALAYRMAVAEACAPAGKVPFLRGGPVAMALVRAVYHHARWLATSYFLYRTPDPQAWEQLYALTAFATACKLEHKAVEDPIEKRSMTVGLLQNQAVTLSLANPYRFSQRELSDLWTLTRDTASLIELTPQRFAAAGALVMIDRDAAPVFVSRAPNPGDGDVFWVDLRKLNDLVRAAVSHAGAAREALLRLSRDYHLSLPVPFLAKALEGWAQDASRGFVRLEGGYNLECALGMTAVHFQAAGQRDLDSFLRDASPISMSAAEQASWAGAVPDANLVTTVSVRVQDQSLGGYRLRWEAADGVRVRVGELIGLSLEIEATARDWAVGTVRWLRYEEDGAIEAGVDLVARRCQASAFRALDAGNAGQTAIRALALVASQDATSIEIPELYLMDGHATLDATQVEVVCMADRWDSSFGSSNQVSNRPGMKTRRRVGDYVVVSPDVA